MVWDSGFRGRGVVEFKSSCPGIVALRSLIFRVVLSGFRHWGLFGLRIQEFRI